MAEWKALYGLVVTGWRGPLDDAQEATVLRVLTRAVHNDELPDMRLYDGGASGVDNIASKFALAKSIHSVTVRPDWSKHGRAAGPLRNEQMVELAVKECQLVEGFAFPHPTESLGTWDCVQRMAAHGIDVTVVPLPVYGVRVKATGRIV